MRNANRSGPNAIPRFRRGRWAGVIEMLEPRRLLSAFTTAIDNPCFPLVPGTTYVYRGVDGEGAALLHRVTVTDETKEVTGVATRIVRSQEFADGELTETTEEWFAQDRFGNVWYFGEDTNEIEDEIVSRAGSWIAGKGGAQPGIIMPAEPRVGERYLQENHPGVAEDAAEVLAVGARLNVPFGAFRQVIQTADTNALEPEVLEHKWYARGVGFVMAEDISGDDGGEIVQLTTIELTPQATAVALSDRDLLLIPGIEAIRRASSQIRRSSPIRSGVDQESMPSIAGATSVLRESSFSNLELIADTNGAFEIE